MERKAISVDSVNRRYKPTYHASVPAGWANDPNGMIWFDGKAHLFFQHYPYDVVWGPMHWGHLVSEDLIRWEQLPIALAPDQDYDRELGCFSGTAIEREGKLYLMYTAALHDRQQQCLAVSEDGVHFEKSEKNPVIRSEDLPEGASIADFRDPKVFHRDGKYYCLLGTMHHDRGDILLYRSEDLEQWEFVGGLMEPEDREDHRATDGVFECPDYRVIDGQEILFTSPVNLPEEEFRFQNSQVAVWMPGKLDLETGRFTYDYYRELDQGFDFYAPQTMALPDGRTVLIAWKEVWNRDFPTAKDNWVGSFTLPRELRFISGHLYQNPIRELENYRSSPVTAENLTIPADGEITVGGVNGSKVELKLTLDLGTAAEAGVKLFQGEGQETLVYYDRARSCVVLDRSKSGIPIRGKEANTAVRRCSLCVDNVLEMQLFLDVSCVEVFLQGGRHVMTGNVYPDAESTGIAFFARGGEAKLLRLEKYEIKVE